MRVKQDDVIKKLHSFTKNIIQRRRTQLIQELESTDKSITTELNGKKALLDILLQSTTADGKSLSNEDIREEVDTFMFEVGMCTAYGILFIFSIVYPTILGTRHHNNWNLFHAPLNIKTSNSTE